MFDRADYFGEGLLTTRLRDYGRRQIRRSSFTIVGFGFNFRDFNASLSQNSSLPFSIGLTNTGGAPLTGLIASTANVSASSVTLTLDPTSLPATLAAGQTADLRLSVAAGPTALGGELTLTIAESHGFLRTLPIRAQVAAAEAIPQAVPQAFELGLLAGQSRLQPITLTNRGFAPWRGVRLTAPTMDWVHIDGLRELGDIPPGGNANFTLRIEPPLSLPTTAYAQNPLLEVQSVNAATVPINAGITVTSSRQSGLVFNVINTDKPRTAGGLGAPVPGAVATLKSADIAGLSFKASADANGVIQFANVPSGNYAWTLEAAGFQPDAGTILLDPGLTRTLERILVTATITYTWSVTPTTVVDKYGVSLSVDFKTDVPAPIVVVDPTVLTIDAPSHVDAFGQFTVTNLGLVSAHNVALKPKTPDGDVVITLPFATIPELKPQQSVTVPFKISHGAILPPGALTPPPHCHTAAMAAEYTYTCAAGATSAGQAQPLAINVGTPSGCTTPAAVSIAGPGGGSGAIVSTPPPSPPPSGVKKLIVSLKDTVNEFLFKQPSVQPVLSSCKAPLQDCEFKSASTELVALDPIQTKITCNYICCGRPFTSTLFASGGITKAQAEFICKNPLPRCIPD